MMLRRQCKSEFDWLEYDILSGLIHGTVLRRGEPGIKQIEKALNIGFLRYPSKQVHGIEVVKVGLGDRGSVSPCDALMTNEVGVPLMVRHADCQAAIFYDPVRPALAVAHCGWRGNVQNIYGAVVRDLLSTYGCRPADLRVAISPSLGPEAAEFVNFRDELPEPFWQYRLAANRFDFWAISREQLMQTGIIDGHIQIARLCTFANSEDFYSYRRDKDTGRHMTFACLGIRT